MDVHAYFYLVHMSRQLKATRYGKCEWEKRLCQRAAPCIELPSGLRQRSFALNFEMKREVADLPCDEDQINEAENVERLNAKTFEVANIEGACAIEQPEVLNADGVGFGNGFECDETYPRDENKSVEKIMKSDNLGVLGKVSDCLESLGKYSGIVVTDDIIAEIEGLVALFVTICGCKDYVSIASAVFLYLRRFSSTSVTRQVMDYLHDMFKMEGQEGEEIDVAASTSWIEMLKSCTENWQLVKSSKLFSHFSKLLALIVTLGLCDATKLTFDIKEFRVFEPDMKVIHGSAIDLIDAALGTVTYFVETIALAWHERSLRPFLVSDAAASEIETEYATLVQWWELVKNGNLMKIAKVSDQEFDNRLEKLTTRLRPLLSLRASYERKMIEDKYTALLNIKNDYVVMKQSSGLRKAPFCIELFGASSQGKSTCCEQITDALLFSAGLPIGKEYQASYNPSDRYMSSWTTDKQVLLIDDMCNEKSNFVERPPTRAIIEVCNNQMVYANKAEIGAKGKVFVEPEMVMVTTNTKDLDAAAYSNCPYSIQRRAHAVITVTAKSAFQYIVDGRPQGIDAKKVAAYYAEKGIEPAFDDIWSLTVEKAVAPKQLKHTAGYKPVVYRGKELKNAPFPLVLQYLISEFQGHREAQTGILERAGKRVNKMQHCDWEVMRNGRVERCIQMRGYCDEHNHLWEAQEKSKQEKIEAQFGPEVIRALEITSAKWFSKVSGDYWSMNSFLDNRAASCIMRMSSAAMGQFDWVKLLPSSWMRDSIVQNGMMYFEQDNVRRIYARLSFKMWCVLGFGTGCCVYNRNYKLITPIVAYGMYNQVYRMKSVAKQAYKEELIERNDEWLTPTIKNLRDTHVEKVCKAAGIVGVMYTLSRMYRLWRDSGKTQGSLEPKTLEEIRERDSESNVWTEVTPRPLPVVPDAANTTSVQLNGLVQKNLVYGTVNLKDGRVLMVNGLFLTSNLVVIPYHYFKEDTLDVTFRKANPEKAGGKFAVRLSKVQSWRCPDSDLAYCYACSGGSFKNLRKYLTDDEIPMHEFGMLWRNKKGEITEAGGIAINSEVTVTTDGQGQTFIGYKYSNLTMNTFSGLCGAALYSKRRAILTGMHTGGVEGAPRGCACKLRRKDMDTAMTELRKVEGVIFSGSGEVFETQVLGVKVLTSKPLHKRSPLNFLPPHTQISYIGSCPGMATFKTDVKVTKISHIVTEVTGDPNVYRGPIEEPQYFGWQQTLENMSIPALPYEPELLQLAIRDYKDDLLKIFRSNLWNQARPLTYEENVNGIVACKFIDGIKMNTSIGYPLSGTKDNFVEEICPTEDFPCNRKFFEEIEDQILACEEKYARGERAYTIAKACKKDEVLSKPKCRIFYGNSIMLTFLVRKYYLPLVRVLQMNPLKSECAVGINSHGPEWQQLHDYVLKHGKDRIIGGDYGKYDQKLPSQVIFAALRILIDFARECDYTERDISIMEAMTGDIVYAIIAFNGDLIALTEGTHISGNSLTVIINGIAGALNLRACFYTMYPATSFEERIPFRRAVSLSTYGDDNVGSVAKGFDKFTIKNISEFLGEYGQVYTMPDKESELVDYLPYEEFEFIKRKSVYHPELGCNVGALCDKSCFKMLHCYLRKKDAPLTEEHACAQNIDTALREWFNHGQEIYEMRQQQMREIARKAEIAHLCTELNVTYADRVKEWREKYIPNYSLQKVRE